jgi:hypothetical protein
MSDSSQGSPYGRFSTLAEETPEQNRPIQDDNDDEVLAQAAGTRLRAHSHTPMITLEQAIEQVKQPATPSDSGSGEEPNYNIAMDLLPESPTDEQLEQMRKIFAKPKVPKPEPNVPLTTEQLLKLNTIFKSKTPQSSPTSPLRSFAARTLHSAARGISGMALLPPFQIASATATVVPTTTTASALFSQPKGKAKKTSTTASGSGAIFSGGGGGSGSGGGGGAPGSPGGGGSGGGGAPGSPGGGGGGGAGGAAVPLPQGQGFAQIPAAGGGLVGVPPKLFDGSRTRSKHFMEIFETY